MKKLMMALCAVATMVIVGCGVDQSSPESVAKGFVQSLIDGDVVSYVEKCGSESISAQEKSMLKEVGEMASKEAKEKGVKIVETKADVKGDKAVVKVTTTEKGDKKEVIPVRLVKKDGKWFVNTKSL